MTSSPPSYYWPGFVLGFLLLTLASCGGLAMVFGLNEVRIADITGQGPAWTPPPMPTATVTSPPPAAGVAAATAPPTPAGRFRPGQVVRNITGSRVNIRRQPGYLGPQAGVLVAQVQPGDRVTIVSGPQRADDLNWWLVTYEVGGRIIEGWVAEATASGVQIIQ